MGIFSFFARGSNEPETPIDPFERAKAAVDELNAAIDALQNIPEYRGVRAWVRQGDARYRRRSKVMLGYWRTAPDPQMIILYGDDKPGMV